MARNTELLDGRGPDRLQGEGRPDEWRLAAVVLLVGLALALWAYLPSLDAGFYFDDISTLVDRASLHMERITWDEVRDVIQGARHPRRPIANLSFALNHRFDDLDPRPYHLVNLLLHLLVGCAVFWLARLIAVDRRREVAPVGCGAFGVAVPAVLFLVHPLNVQAVTYVSQRMTLLATLFGLLSIGCYILARHRGGWRTSWMFWLLAGGCWLLAVGSKENALAIPLVVALYEWCFLGTSPWRALVGRWRSGDRWPRIRLVALVASIVVGAVLLIALYYPAAGLTLGETLPGRDYSGWQRVLTQPRVHSFYLSLALWPAPSRLNLEHDVAASKTLLEPSVTLLAALFWLAVVAGAVRLARWRPRFAFPLLAYLALHLIESGPLNLELIFEHRMYLPLAVLAASLPPLVEAVPVSRWAPLFGVAGALALVLAVATHQRNQLWADPIRFHEDCVAKSPAKARPHNNLATVLAEAGRWQEASVEFEKAIALEPNHLKARLGLSRAYAELGLEEQAEAELGAAAQIRAESVAVLLEIGSSYQRQGQLVGAVAFFRRAVESFPEHVGSRYNLGAVLMRLGRAEEAARHLEIVRSRDPSFAPTYRPLADAYLAMGRPADALETYRQAVRRDPGDGAAHLALGTQLGASGQLEPAEAHLWRAVELVPEDSQAHNNLANIYFQLGRLEEARRHYRISVELNPDNAEAHYNLALVSQRLGSDQEAARHLETARRLGLIR